MVRAMYDLKVGVFEHLEITSPMDADQRILYTQRILRGTDIKKYKQILEGCKVPIKGISRDQWALVVTKDVTTEQFCTWEKTETNVGSGGMYLGAIGAVTLGKIFGLSWEIAC